MLYDMKLENLELKKRLIEAQSQVLQMQYIAIEKELNEYKSSIDNRKWDDICNQKIAEAKKTGR